MMPDSKNTWLEMHREREVPLVQLCPPSRIDGGTDRLIDPRPMASPFHRHDWKKTLRGFAGYFAIRVIMAPQAAEPIEAI